MSDLTAPSFLTSLADGRIRRIVALRLLNDAISGRYTCSAPGREMLQAAVAATDHAVEHAGMSEAGTALVQWADREKAHVLLATRIQEATDCCAADAESKVWSDDSVCVTDAPSQSLQTIVGVPVASPSSHCVARQGIESRLAACFDWDSERRPSCRGDSRLVVVCGAVGTVTLATRRLQTA
jgi:hypothetical protein